MNSAVAEVPENTLGCLVLEQGESSQAAGDSGAEEAFGISP